MRNITRMMFFFTLSIFSATVFAETVTENNDFVAALVNRSGHVAKFYYGDTSLAVAITSNTSIHLLWDAAPSVPLHLMGFTTMGKYVAICPNVQHVMAGQTVSIFSRSRVNAGTDFYCEIESPVH